MNIKWLIIAAIGLVLFVMMGRNPFEAPANYVPTDPVKESLRKRAAGESLESDGFLGSFGGGGFQQAPLLPTTPNNGGALMPAPAAPQQQPQTPASPFENLPTTGQDPNNPLNQTLPPGVWRNDEFRPNLTVADGKPIRFIGIYAFTLDPKGNVIPQPDGEYVLMNGARIVIKDGTNQWYPLQWKSSQG